MEVYARRPDFVSDLGQTPSRDTAFQYAGADVLDREDLNRTVADVPRTLGANSVSPENGMILASTAAVPLGGQLTIDGIRHTLTGVGSSLQLNGATTLSGEAAKQFLGNAARVGRIGGLGLTTFMTVFLWGSNPPAGRQQALEQQTFMNEFQAANPNLTYTREGIVTLPGQLGVTRVEDAAGRYTIAWLDQATGTYRVNPNLNEDGSFTSLSSGTTYFPDGSAQAAARPQIASQVPTTSRPTVQQPNTPTYNPQADLDYVMQAYDEIYTQGGWTTNEAAVDQALGRLIENGVMSPTARDSISQWRNFNRQTQSAPVIGGVQATVLNGRETYDAVRDDVRAANGKAIDNGAFDLTSVIIPTENGLSMLRTDITRGEAQSFINTMLDSPYLLNGVSASDIIRVNGLSPLLGVLDQKATVLSNPWERLPNPSVPQGLPRLPPAVPPDAPRLPPAADPPSIPPGNPRLPPAVPPDAPLLPSAGQTGQSVAASPASPPPGGEPPEPIEGRLIEPFSTWTMATWLTHLGGNGVAQGVQYAHFRLSEETRKDSEPIDTLKIPGEVEEFVQNPQAYLRQNYTGGPLGMSVDGAIYKETLPTNEVQYFQRMPSDLYTAYASELGNPDKIRLPQYVDINGQGEEWVTVEMRPPARDEPWLGGEGVEFIERETNFSAPSGRLAVTVGPPEGIRSRLNGEVTILNPYFSGDATLVEIVPADGAATIRQYNNINLAVIGGSLRMSVGNSDLERVNDNDPTRGPQLSITGGTTARARLSNRLEYNLVSGTPNNTGGMDPTFRPGEARWRSVLQGITTSSTSVVLSDPTGAVTGDVTNAIDNALPGQFQWDQDTPGRQRVFINVGQDLWVNGPDGRFGRIGSFTKDDAGNLILNASGSPDRSISRTSGSLLGNPTGEFNIQIGVQNDDVPNLPDLVQEGATWVANRADPTPATGARATEDTGEELTSFVRRGTLDQATPFQGDLGTVMDGWSQLYGGDALVLSGRRMPTTPEGQVATWHSPEGQEHIRLGWIETLDGNYATVETLIPKTGRGAVPHDTEQGLLLRYAMEQAGMSVGVPLTNDEKISVDRRIRDGAVPPSLVN